MGDKPKLTQNTRKINVVNKCGSDIRLISTLPGDWKTNKSLQVFERECNNKDNSITQTPINGVDKCIYPYQFKPKNMVIGATPTSFTENLFTLTSTDTNIDEWVKIGGVADNPYRPSGNYYAIWDTLYKDVDSITDGKKGMSHYQPKIEFTFGGNNGYTDVYDVSTMLEGGCGIHSNPMDNDIGYMDIDGSGKTYKPKNSCTKATYGRKISDPTLQVSHNVKDFQEQLKNKSDPVFQNILDSNQSNQQKGCLNSNKVLVGSTKSNPPAQCPITVDSKVYACGWPNPIYRYPPPTGTPYYISTNGDDLQKNRVYTNPTLTKLADPTLGKEIIDTIRNELFECTKQQLLTVDPTKKFPKKNTPKDKIEYNTVIDVSVKPNNECGSEEGGEIKCIYDNNNLLTTCPHAYTFDFDDSKSTFGCAPPTNVPTPEYTITFCPESSGTSVCGSPPSNPQYGYWSNVINNTKYAKCTNGYNDNSVPTPSIQCNSSTNQWSQPYPTTKGYCKPPPKPQPPKPQPPKPQPPKPKPTKPKPTKHHSRHKKVDTHSKSKIDYYAAPNRNDELEEHYTSIHAEYTTTEQLNDLITQFYKPNCSLYLNVPKDTLLKYPEMRNIQAYPGESHCFGKIKDIKKDIKKGINKK